MHAPINFEDRSFNRDNCLSWVQQENDEHAVILTNIQETENETSHIDKMYSYVEEVELLVLTVLIQSLSSWLMPYFSEMNMAHS